MPSPDAILAAATLIAGAWRPLAIAWHVAVAVLLFFMLRHASRRRVALALAAPALSVSALAWWSANPFTGLIFLLLAALLVVIALALPSAPVVFAVQPHLVMGAALTGFGWTYPHFVTGERWAHYLYAAPVGLLPCPTLAMVAGVSLMAGSFGSRRWATAVAAAMLVYGLIGVFVLGVSIDVVLVLGTIALGVHGSSERHLRCGSSFG